MDGTTSVLAAQGKLVKIWCKTVDMLKGGKKLSAGQVKALQLLAKAEVEKLNPAGKFKQLAYLEAIFAFDLYKSHNLTTIAATGAYFKYDRTEALRSLIAYAKTGKMGVPKSAIAKMLTVPVEVYSQLYEEIKAELNGI